MFGDELRQLMQRDVCSHHPQQNALVLLHEESHTHTEIQIKTAETLCLVFFFFFTHRFVLCAEHRHGDRRRQTRASFVLQLEKRERDISGLN